MSQNRISTGRCLWAKNLWQTVVIGALAGWTAAVPAAQLKPLDEKSLAAAVEDQASDVRMLIDGLQKSIPSGNRAVFNGALDADALLERVTRPASFGHTNDLREAFAEGTRKSWRDRSLADEFLGHHMGFLRVKTYGERAGLLFRASNDQGSLNYYMFTLGRTPTGELKIDDYYMVGLGEYLSESLRRGYLTLLRSLEPKGEDGRRASLYVKSLNQVVQINQSLRRKDYAQVLGISRTLPEEVRSDRGIMLMRIEAAEKTSLQERVRIFDEWKRNFPNEMGLPLKIADLHIAEGRFVDAERLLRSLDRELGGDSYVKLRIGEVRVLQRRADRLQAAKALPAAPSTAETAQGR